MMVLKHKSRASFTILLVSLLFSSQLIADARGFVGKTRPGEEQTDYAAPGQYSESEDDNDEPDKTGFKPQPMAPAKKPMTAKERRLDMVN